VNPVQMTAKLYDCRDAARRMLGAHYKQGMEGWALMIRNYAETNRCDDLAAAMKLAEGGDGFMQITILAAYVEMKEPSAESAGGAG
jgi:hypothetical protein